MTTAITTKMVESLEEEMAQFKNDFPRTPIEEVINWVVEKHIELQSGESISLKRILRGLNGLSTATVLDKKLSHQTVRNDGAKEYWWQKLDR